jgi:hypothetical protein
MEGVISKVHSFIVMEEWLSSPSFAVLMHICPFLSILKVSEYVFRIADYITPDLCLATSWLHNLIYKYR